MRVIFFDCECVNSPKAPDYSWGRPWQLGLAVCATTEKADGPRQWLETDAGELVHYFGTADAIVGFNSHRFDLPLIDGESCLQMSAASDYSDPAETVTLAEGLQSHGIALVDMFLDIKLAVGQKKGTDLKSLSVCTLGKQRGMDGAIAPVAWAEHRKLEVIQYCADDVSWSRDLFNHGLRQGWLKRPATYREQRKGQNRPPIQFPITWHVRTAAGEVVEPFRDWYKRTANIAKEGVRHE